MVKKKKSLKSIPKRLLNKKDTNSRNFLAMKYIYRLKRYFRTRFPRAYTGLQNWHRQQKAKAFVLGQSRIFWIERD